MINYRRKLISAKYFAIEIYECPIDIIMFAANLGANNVTIENYRQHRNPDSISIVINHNQEKIHPKLKQIVTDFQLSKTAFISLKEIWDKQGCYAVFHEGDELKFKATDLNEAARYRALDNFNWTLEMAIPDSTYDGWGQMTAPNKNIIDQIEAYICSIKNQSI